MGNYKIEENEVVLLEDTVTYSDYNGNLQLTLTSNKIIIQKEVEKGIFKKTKTKNVVDIINLSDIKIYNDKVQIKSKSSEVNIQTFSKNISITFSSILKANKFTTKVIDTITGTTATTRGVNKIKGAIDTVDDVLGIDTRDTLKGVIENGIAGTLIKGIHTGKRNKRK